jgi:uncharacterized DUF497 family protein
MRFTWDETKRQGNLNKHGLDFADAEKVFAGPPVLFEDNRHDYGEQRDETDIHYHNAAL